MAATQKMLGPKIIYGTAWKKERTADCVEMALRAGFRGIDTACQPRHYHEAGVGEGLERARAFGIERADVFLQTKFTPEGGQDPTTIPYDPRSPLRVQVASSFATSLKNLRTDYLDSLVLHSPLPRWDDFVEVWESMEALVGADRVRQIGISNCYDPVLLGRIISEMDIRPAVVQNRFYRETGYDIELRRICSEHGITYQSFWTLTANPDVLRSPALGSIAANHDAEPAAILFAFLIGTGIQPLTGTTSRQHMADDLRAAELELTAMEMLSINQLGPFL